MSRPTAVRTSPARLRTTIVVRSVATAPTLGWWLLLASTARVYADGNTWILESRDPTPDDLVYAPLDSNDCLGDNTVMAATSRHDRASGDTLAAWTASLQSEAQHCRRAFDELARAEARRTTVMRAAQRDGLSLQQIADATGLSRGRVDQAIRAPERSPVPFKRNDQVRIVADFLSPHTDRQLRGRVGFFSNPILPLGRRPVVEIFLYPTGDPLDRVEAGPISVFVDQIELVPAAGEL